MRIGGRVPIPLVFALGSLWAAGVVTLSAQQSPRPKVSFSKDVLPILSDKCFRCHGPDATARMANLRLDLSESAFALRHGEFAIVPHAPRSSLLIRKINDPDSPMPPPSSGKSLSKQEKQTLEQWIAEGAHYGSLWSFEPIPESVQVPKVASGWATDDLDHFILARIVKEGLHPTRPANRERLLRRVTLDLTGLPPSEMEISAFETDRSPGAYERVVDRLLSSPHFGERMAVEWLDAARYSDSYGYQSDLLSPTWPYRDWVVRAFNQNLSYDKFLTYQLAGDLLPSPTRDQRLATAFNRLHRQSNEGGSIALEFKTLYTVDRVDTFGTSMLGLTVGCARCHDHKFDPITQREYYQLFGYFNSIDEYGLLLSTEIVPTPSMLLPTANQEARLKVLQERDAAAKLALEKTESEAASAVDRRGEKPDPTTMSSQAFRSVSGSDLGDLRRWRPLAPLGRGTGRGVRTCSAKRKPLKEHLGSQALRRAPLTLRISNLSEGSAMRSALRGGRFVPLSPTPLPNGARGPCHRLPMPPVRDTQPEIWALKTCWPELSNGRPAHFAQGAEQATSTLKPITRFQSWLAKHPTEATIPGLLAHLSLDRLDSGKFVNDLGGKAYGEPLGGLSLVAGHKGGGVLFDGDNGLAVRGLPARERWDPFTWSFWIDDPRPAPGPVILLHRTGGTDVGFCGFDLTLEDGYLTARVMRHWPGNAVAVRTKSPLPKDRWTHVAWSWDGLGRAAGLKLYLDGKPAQTTVLRDKLWKKINAYGDLGPSAGDWSFAQRFRDTGFKGGKLDDVSFADRPLSDLEVAQLYDGKAIAEALNSPEGHRAELRGYFAQALDEPSLEARNNALRAQQALAEYEDGIYEVSVMEETPSPIPAYLLARGQYDAPRNEKTLVTRNVPKSLPPLEPQGRNDRLALAKWLTRPHNPLTARVAVNRLWQMIFGTGLVETSENFGSQGSQPTHPELLDYLARQFIDSGWNVKGFVRRLVLSSTYRQDSVQTKRLHEIDPHNRLYARGPSNRLPAEMLRDTVLAAGGLLDKTLGGPPVNPYQPAGIWQENNTMSPPFVQSKGADLYRRSLYSTWKRTTPVPSMVLFDAGSREACTVRRPTTNTPLQALVLLNDIQFVEAARILAQKVLTECPNDSTRIQEMFLRLAGRAPDATETSVLLETLKEQRDLFATDETGAKKLIAVGESKPPSSIPAKELAAMTVTAQTVMNSDAVVWKR